MTWQELIHSERYLKGEVLCLHHRIVFPECGINESESDFLWVRRPFNMLVAKGPIEKLMLNTAGSTFTVKWVYLEELDVDFSAMHRLRGADETGNPDMVTVNIGHHEPKQAGNHVLYLGTGEEVTDVYLLPKGYTFDHLIRDRNASRF